MSAILPVYNEEMLLPYTLANIEPYVDEIIVIDGSPDGPSTDKTAAIASKFADVVYTDGRFRTLDGAWDMVLQRNTGIKQATGDILLFISADMIFKNMELLREAIDGIDSHKLFFCTTVEFWLDTRHIRLYSGDGDALSVPSGVLQAVAIDTHFNPYYEADGRLVVSAVAESERILVPETIKFHLGWIRPFASQVKKHIDHVKQHRWEQMGEELLAIGDQALERWAITHVLSYPQIPHVDCESKWFSEIESLRDMAYNDGAQEIVSQYEQDYGSSVLKPTSHRTV